MLFKVIRIYFLLIYFGCNSLRKHNKVYFFPMIWFLDTNILVIARYINEIGPHTYVLFFTSSN